MEQNMITDSFLLYHITDSVLLSQKIQLTSKWDVISIVF